MQLLPLSSFTKKLLPFAAATDAHEELLSPGKFDGQVAATNAVPMAEAFRCDMLLQPYVVSRLHTAVRSTPANAVCCATHLRPANANNVFNSNLTD